MPLHLPIDWTAAADEEGCEARNRRAVTASGTRDAHAASCSTRLLRVLVVDDDRDTTDGMVLLVKLWGHDAFSAYGGVAALIAAAIQPPDVVLLDIAMAGMDGCQLSRRLRADPRTRDCLLIAITGYSDVRYRLLCEAAGIDVCLLKPAKPEILETLMLLEYQRLGGAVQSGRTGPKALTLGA